jgi:hypothetical protein
VGQSRSADDSDSLGDVAVHGFAFADGKDGQIDDNAHECSSFVVIGCQNRTNPVAGSRELSYASAFENLLLNTGF